MKTSLPAIPFSHFQTDVSGYSSKVLMATAEARSLQVFLVMWYQNVYSLIPRGEKGNIFVPGYPHPNSFVVNWSPTFDYWTVYWSELSPLSSWEDHLPQKSHLYFSLFSPNYFGPSKCSLCVCCERILAKVTVLLIFSWTRCTPLIFGDNSTYYQVRMLNQAGLSCLFPFSGILSHCIK